MTMHTPIENEPGCLECSWLDGKIHKYCERCLDLLYGHDEASQARSWESVYDLCKSLGMPALSPEYDTGQEHVLGFIRKLSESRDTLERECERLREAMQSAFITCNSESGNYTVVAKFPALEEAQEFHSLLVHLKADKQLGAGAAAVREVESK